MLHPRRLATFLFAVTLLLPVFSHAQEADPAEEALQPRDPLQVTFQSKEHRLGVEAAAVPLRDVLDKVNKLTGVKFWVAPGINPAISRNVPNLPIERAIKHVLGPRANYVMIYADVTDAEGNARAVLDEVRVLEGGIIDPGDGSAAAAAPPPPSASTGLSQMSPEELAARQAEKQAKMAEKAEQRAARAAAKNSNRGGRGGRSGQAATPDPAAAQPPTGQTDSTGQPQSPQVGGTPSGQESATAPPTGSSSTGGGRRRGR